MSDFLTRASEAALGARRAVQPLVASRYAPGPRQPTLEMEILVDQSAAVGPATGEKSNEATARPPGAALSDSHDVHDQRGERQERAQDPWPATSVRETVTAFPAQSFTRRQDGVASTTQSDEYSVQSTNEQKELSVPTPVEDRVPPASGSIRPVAVTVPDSADEAQSNQTTLGVAPLSVRAMSVEAAETQTTMANAVAGESELIGPPSIPSLPPVDHPELVDSPSRRHSTFVERRLDAARSDGDTARPSANRFNDAAIVTNKGSEVGRTEPERHLDQSSFDLRDMRRSPHNSAHRPFATRRVSQSPITSDRGPQNAPEPPIIRVTIGRIDVRAAVPPAPPAETAAPPKPKMSLDEYLRQHNGRRR